MRAEEAYQTLKLAIGNFIERNQFTYITAESRWRNLMLSLFCPSILMSAGQLVQEMQEMLLLIHTLEERLINENKKQD